MNKKIGILFLAFIIGNISLLQAQDLLPSDVYYNENIAVNEISASSPTVKGPSADAGPPDPGGGEVEIDGPQVNGEDAPIGDAFYPLLTAGILYASFIFFRRRKLIK